MLRLMPEPTPSLRQGRVVETPVAGEMLRAFVPPPLPPEPSIDVFALLERLSLAKREEAVLLSQIEGTQSTLSDLLRF